MYVMSFFVIDKVLAKIFQRVFTGKYCDIESPNCLEQFSIMVSIYVSFVLKLDGTLRKSKVIQDTSYPKFMNNNQKLSL